MDFSKVRVIIFSILLGAVSIFFLYVVRPLFYPIFWAAVIASIAYPLYVRLKSKIKYANLSAAIILLATTLVIIVPVVFIGSLLVKETIELYGELGDKGGQISGGVQAAVNWIKHSSLGELTIDENFWIEKVSEVATLATNLLLSGIRSFTENSLTFLLMFVIMLYALFYFIRDGAKILRKAMRLFPLGDKHEVMFYNKFTSAARAAIKGTLVIGLVQGGLGTLLFFAVGIKGALIWGTAMMLFSILIGAYFIWVPAGLIMLALGHTWQGVLIFAVGILIISTIDNLLRPMLIGRDIQMHPLLIFLSTLGGALVFGLSGFVIGPVITALLISFWEMYEHYYKQELSHD